MLEEMIARANSCVDGYAKELTEMADRIFDHPEIGPHEVFASGLLTDWLEAHAFAGTRGVGGLEPAFRAVWKNGEGGHNLGHLCENDALPGIGFFCFY